MTNRMTKMMMLGALCATGGALGCDAPPQVDDGPEPILTVPNTLQGEYRTEMLDLTGDGPQSVTYQVDVDGRAILDGDIVLDLEKLRAPADGDASRGAARKPGQRRWTGAKMPYVIEAPLSQNDARIAEAIEILRTNTALTFVKRTNEADYIRFVESKRCFSNSVGRNGGPVTLEVASGALGPTPDAKCVTGDVIHEILHAAGLWHEQQRGDRDSWIFVDKNNITAGKEGEYSTFVEMGLEGINTGPFDFDSIMLYDSGAFAKDPSKPVMSKCSAWGANGRCTAGSANRWYKQVVISAGDINAVNRMYPRFKTFSEGNLPQMSTTFRPAITSWARDRLDVLAIASDGSIRHTYSNNGGVTWGGWENWGLWGGKATSGISAVSWGPGRIDAAFRGQNGNLWHFWYENGFMGAEDWGQPIKFDPGISSWGPGNVDLFGVAPDGSARHLAYRNGWQTWENLGGTILSGIDAVSWGPGRIDIVSRNSWGRIVRQAFITNRWDGWADHGGSLSQFTPSIVAGAVNHLDMFATFSDGKLYRRTWDNGWELDFGWAGGSTIGEVDIVVDVLGRFDLVGVGSGGIIRHASIRNN